MNKKSILSKITNIYFLSFILPLFMTLGVIIYRGIYPFGKYSFMFTDMYHQYVPFLTGLWDKLHSGESLAYTFRIGLGTNYASIYAYYLASPINWLCYFFKRENLMEFMTFVILFKMALSGLTFCYYLSKHFQKKELYMVWFSVFYAMSGFMTAYYWNHMWLDVVFMAPLVILGLEELIVEGRVKRYILCLTYCILTNYYLSIILCIFLVLYFLLYLGIGKVRGGIGYILATLRFATASLLAGGMSAVLLVPVLFSMQGTGYLNNSLPKKIEIYFDFLSMMARHVPMLETERRLAHWPNIYCGVFVFVLIPLYLFSKNIRLREKIGHLLLLAVFYAAFSINILNFIWHGMNYPNSLPARQSFLYIFVVLTMCATAVEKDEGRKLPRILAWTTGFLLLTVCAIFVKKEEFTFTVFACSFIFLGGYFLLKVIFAKCFTKMGWKSMEAFAILLLVCVEACFNLEETAFKSTYRDKYVGRQADNSAFYALAKEDYSNTETLLFRMDNDAQTTKNDASLSGYYSMSVFSSTTNSRVRKLYESLGMGGSKVAYFHTGATAFTESLFSVHYRISDKDEEDTLLYQKIAANWPGEKNVRYLYRNAAALPLGIVLDQKMVTDIEEILAGRETNALVRQNRLAYRLGAAQNLFSALTDEEVKKDAEKSEMTIYVKEDGYLYGAVPFNVEGEVAFTKTTAQNSITWKEKDLSKKRLVFSGYFKAGDELKISAPDEEKFYIKYYRLNEEVLLQLSDKLKESAFTEKSHGENYIEGTIWAKEGGLCIFSIPAEDGFTIILDGKQVQNEEFYDSMVMVPVTKGSHEIKIVYHTKGLFAGFSISAFSIFVFILCTVVIPGKTSQNKKKMDS